MAKEKSAWQRMDDREREKEEGEEESLAQKRVKSGLEQPATKTAGGGSVDSSKIDDQIARADSLIEQLNNLYAQYFAGAERLPPTERRKQLDQLMQGLAHTSKPTKALQFRVSATQSKYTSYRDRWDKMLKDLEAGKIRRRT